MHSSDITRHRLHNQHISAPRASTPADVAAWFGAMQGQDFTGTKWAFALRLPDTTDDEIQAAINNRAIIRTWLMRGTLHFIAAADLHWMLPIFAERIVKRNARRYRQLELDETTLERSKDVLCDALAGGKALDRRTLGDILKENGIAPDGQRCVYMLLHASYAGLIYQAPSNHNNPTFLRVDETLPPPAETFDREQALVELARRYFQSHGPATDYDFAWWSGLTLTDCRAAIAAIESELDSTTTDDGTYWFVPAAPQNGTSPDVYLLPGFDEYVLGYKDRSAALEPDYAQRICPGNNGMFIPTVVIDGQIRGTWKRTVKSKAVHITLDPFTSFSAAERRAIEAAARPYGDYLQLPVVLE